MLKRFVMGIVLIVIAFSPTKSIAGSLTITDSIGRQVSLEANPERIICLGPGTLRLIVYLQAENKVAGVEALEKNYPNGRPYWMAHPELAKLPTCGPGGVPSINQKPDLETVLGIAPQVIFVTYMSAELADKVQELLDIPVVVLSYGEFSTFDETVYGALRIAGEILGQTDRAEAVIGQIEAWRADLWRRTGDVSEENRPRAYIGGIGFRAVQGIESSQHNYPPLAWVNAVNLAREAETRKGSHVVMSRELLLKLDPPTIFIDGGGIDLIAGNVAKKPDYYKALTAFGKGRFYVLHPFNWYTTNIDTALTDAYTIGKILYPKKFKDLDPEKKADEIYTALVGKPVYDRMKAAYGPNGMVAPFVK